MVPAPRASPSTRAIDKHIDTPPFEGYAVTCGVTFTFGGLRIDTDGEVLNTDYQPIPGLYAAGELVGGLFYFNYPGGSGLMSGTVFGKIAGTSARPPARTEPPWTPRSAAAQHAFGKRDRERNRGRQDDLRSGGERLRGADRRTRRRGEGVRDSMPLSRSIRRAHSIAADAAARCTACRWPKDTLDTFDMPTEMGSPIYRGNRPRADASCVALLRRAGAIIFGKTATANSRRRSAGDDQSARSRWYAWRFIERFGGGGRRFMVRQRSARRPAVRCCALRRFAAYLAKAQFQRHRRAGRLAGRQLHRHHRLARPFRRRRRAFDDGAAHGNAATAARAGHCATHWRLAHRFVGYPQAEPKLQ